MFGVGKSDDAARWWQLAEGTLPVIASDPAAVPPNLFEAIP
jgi:hypothetical protein